MGDAERPIDRVRALVKRDRRYPVEAYLFIFESLRHTLQTLGATGHVSGQQLCAGIRDKAVESFGCLARCVFRQWGIHRTGDFGEIVFNLIDIGLMGKTDSDRREDFEDVFDLDEALDGMELKVSLEA